MEARSIEPRMYRTPPHLTTEVETRHIGILVVGPSPPPPFAISLCRADGLGSRRSLAAISTSWPDELTPRRVEPDCAPDVVREFGLDKGKKESRQADSNRLPLLITSDRSGVAGRCTYLQISHNYAVSCSLYCSPLQQIASGLGSN